MDEDHQRSSSLEEAEQTYIDGELSRIELPVNERLRLEGERQRERLEQLLFGVSPAIPSQIGPYRILSELGRGGMGVVYAGYHERLDRKVAVKTMNERATPAMQRLLDTEARAMARLDHPNVATIYESGVFKGTTFIAMEYVEGQTLKDWWKEEKPKQTELLRVFRDAGEGLIAAHEADLVHRDFKPSNVMVDGKGRVFVLDFGLARTDPGHDETLSWQIPNAPRNGWDAGTPAYMAPEQFRGRWADAVSDQYSFCVSLYEALYGEKPFPGASCEQRWAAAEHAEFRPPPPDSSVPSWLRALLLRGLDPKPSERFPDMRALLTELGEGQAREIETQLELIEPTESLMLEGAHIQPWTGREQKAAGLASAWTVAVMLSVVIAVVTINTSAKPLHEDTLGPQLEGAEEVLPPSESQEISLELDGHGARLGSEDSGEVEASADEEGSETGLAGTHEPKDDPRSGPLPRAKSRVAVELFAGTVSKEGWFTFARVDGKHVLSLDPSDAIKLSEGRHELEVRLDEREEWKPHCSFEVVGEGPLRVVLSRKGC